MFAIGKIKAEETLIIWGKGYTNYRAAKEAQANGKLTMQWDDDIFSVEGEGEDDPVYAINHSCDSNAWMRDAFTVTAKWDIDAGEQITADYALWEADENYISQWECGCGSPVCRKKITGHDWRLPGIQDRYNKHFSPLINKRILNLKKTI